MPPAPPMVMAVTPIIASIPVYISAYTASVAPPAAPIVHGLCIARFCVRHTTHYGKRAGACTCRTYDAVSDEPTTLKPRTSWFMLASILVLRQW
jgi:hypothetical protein